MDKEALRKEYQRIELALPPGPWHARGNTVLAGTDTVAVVFAKSASLVAHYISKYPDYLEQLFDGQSDAQERLEKAEARVEELEEKLEDLKAELETAKEENGSLREDLAAANIALDERLAGK